MLRVAGTLAGSRDDKLFDESMARWSSDSTQLSVATWMCHVGCESGSSKHSALAQTLKVGNEPLHMWPITDENTRFDVAVLCRVREVR